MQFLVHREAETVFILNSLSLEIEIRNELVFVKMT